MLTINDINIDYDVEASFKSNYQHSNEIHFKTNNNNNNNNTNYDKWSKKCKKSMIV